MNINIADMSEIYMFNFFSFFKHVSFEHFWASSKIQQFIVSMEY
jgi:hypothetical protein